MLEGALVAVIGIAAIGYLAITVRKKFGSNAQHGCGSCGCGKTKKPS